MWRGEPPFVILDTETANSDRSSCCQVAIVRVTGESVESWSSLVNPAPHSFAKIQQRVHKKTAADVADAPTFADLYPTICEWVSDAPILAHSAGFDRSVMDQCCEMHRLPLLDNNWYCTVEMARHCLPGLSNHKLPMLCRLFGIPLNHHDAESDTAATGELAARLLSLCCGAVDDFRVGARRERRGRVVNAMPEEESMWFPESADVCISLLPSLQECRSQAGRVFVFTGECDLCDRKELETFVKALGGLIRSTVSSKTDVVVIGNSLATSSSSTVKLRRARELAETTGRPELHTEVSFLASLLGHHEE